MTHVKGICQRCGFERPLANLRTEWTGLKVCRDCFDRRHPQMDVRAVADRQSVPGASPEPADVFLGVNDVSANDL